LPTNAWPMLGAVSGQGNCPCLTLCLTPPLTPVCCLYFADLKDTHNPPSYLARARRLPGESGGLDQLGSAAINSMPCKTYLTLTSLSSLLSTSWPVARCARRRTHATRTLYKADARSLTLPRHQESPEITRNSLPRTRPLDGTGTGRPHTLLHPDIDKL